MTTSRIIKNGPMNEVSMNLSIFFIPEALFYEYIRECLPVYAVMVSTILSSAA